MAGSIWVARPVATEVTRAVEARDAAGVLGG